MKASGIGGQALMEGVMMKNGSKYACAVRKPDGEIIVDVQETHAIADKCKVFKWPIIRGAITFIDSMCIGVKTLTWSASFFDEDEAELKKKKEAEKKAKEKGATDEQLAAKAKRQEGLFLFGTVAISIVLAVGIFMILPYFLSMFLKKFISSPALLALCEGLIRIMLFVGYVAAISCMKDIRRVFMYHGAEHKSINCVEQGYELTVNNVRKCSREHKRCGTSFLLIVMVISVVFFVFIRAESTWLMVLIRLLLIPVIAGISYEFIRLAGTSENKVVAFLSKPGLALQNFTTREPDDSMIECAIASVEAVFDWRKYQEEAKQEQENAERAKESSLERRRRERSEETKKNYDEAKNDVVMNPDDEDFDLDAAIAAAVEKRKAARLAEYEKAQREAAGITEEDTVTEQVEEQPEDVSEESLEKVENGKPAETAEGKENTEKTVSEENEKRNNSTNVEPSNNAGNNKNETKNQNGNSHKKNNQKKGSNKAEARKQVMAKRQEEAAENAAKKAEENVRKAEEEKIAKAEAEAKKNAEAVKKAEAEKAAEAAKKVENEKKATEAKAEAAKKAAEEAAEEAAMKAAEEAAKVVETAKKEAKETEKAADNAEKTAKKDKGFNSGRYVPNNNSKPAPVKKEEPEDDGEFAGNEKMNSYFKRPERKDTPKKGSEMSGYYTSTNRNNVYVQTLDSISTPDDEPEDDEVLNALDRFFVGRKNEKKEEPQKAEENKSEEKKTEAQKAEKEQEPVKKNDKGSSGKSKKKNKK